MNIQPQPQSTQLQQHQLSSNTLSSDTNINSKTDTLTISNSEDPNSSLNISSATAATFKNTPNLQQGNNFYVSSSPSPAANNNAANVTNASGNQTYYIQPQNNFSTQAQTGSPMAVKQPLQQQQYQQFANQNSNDIQQQLQQQFQNNSNNNLKYYMTNSPVTTGKRPFLNSCNLEQYFALSRYMISFHSLKRQPPNYPEQRIAKSSQLQQRRYQPGQYNQHEQQQ